METKDGFTVDQSAPVISALAALAQDARLAAFRALVVAGPAGLTPSAMSERLGVAPNTLSHHLKTLMHAGLVSQSRIGRNLVYRAQFDRMQAVLSYLSDNCCNGGSCEVKL